MNLPKFFNNLIRSPFENVFIKKWVRVHLPWYDGTLR
jgi:hypothetical protein